jgi:hypothetical protein
MCPPAGSMAQVTTKQYNLREWVVRGHRDRRASKRIQRSGWRAGNRNADGSYMAPERRRSEEYVQGS